MKHDILLCGVGGQGILSVAYVIDQCAMDAGYYLKQPEVHGMSQRGGAVQAHVRVSDRPIASDLIPLGEADLILSLEPLESLRYLRYMAPERAWLVSDVTPFVNIPDYPDTAALYERLLELPAVILVNGAHLARKAGSPRAQNITVLGAALSCLPYSADVLETHITGLFARKTERLVHLNLNAFRMGKAVGDFSSSLKARGVSQAAISRVLPWLDFHPWPTPQNISDAWAELLLEGGAGSLVAPLWSEAVVLPLDEDVPGKLARGVGPREMVAPAG